MFQMLFTRATLFLLSAILCAGYGALGAEDVKPPAPSLRIGQGVSGADDVQPAATPDVTRRQLYQKVKDEATAGGVASLHSSRFPKVALTWVLLVIIPSLIIIPITVVLWRKRKVVLRLVAVVLALLEIFVLLFAMPFADTLVVLREYGEWWKVRECVYRVASALQRYADKHGGCFPATSEWPDGLVREGLLSRDALFMPPPFGEGKDGSHYQYDISYLPLTCKLASDEKHIVAWQARAAFAQLHEGGKKKVARCVIFSNCRVGVVNEAEFEELLARSILEAPSNPADIQSRTGQEPAGNTANDGAGSAVEKFR